MSAIQSALDRQALTADIIACTRCNALREGGLSPIPLAGRTPAPILVFVEAPGVENDIAGGWLKMGKVPGAPLLPASPQVGMLFRGLTRAGIATEDVAITGVIQCARGLTRGKPDPVQSHHVAACAGFRRRVVDLVNPTWIVTCGGSAAKVFLPFKVKVGKDHGTWWRGTVGPAMGRRVFVTYHPQAGYRDEKAERAFREDLKGLGMMVGGDVGETNRREMKGR